jgi:hypothetical protein
MKYQILLILSLFFTNLFSQKDSTIFKREKVLSFKLSQIRNASLDEEKKKLNLEFRDFLLETLYLSESYNYSFPLLRTVGIIDSPDKSFRIVNWNLQLEDESNLFYCFIVKKGNKKKNKIVELTNKKTVYEMPKDVINETNWYGALYYKIIPVKKGKKLTYTLLGWRSNGNISNMKLIDIIQITGNHVKLGAPIFISKKQKLNRVCFEYSKKSSMSLRYDEKYDRLLFDHLSPESPTMEGFYEYYVPDMSYDAYIFNENYWILYEDVIAINDPEKKTYKQITIDKKTGEIKEEEVNKNWIDPSDPNAPGSPNKHVPVLPKIRKKK